MSDYIKKVLEWLIVICMLSVYIICLFVLTIISLSFIFIEVLVDFFNTRKRI